MKKDEDKRVIVHVPVKTSATKYSTDPQNDRQVLVQAGSSDPGKCDPVKRRWRVFVDDNGIMIVEHFKKRKTAMKRRASNSALPELVVA